MDATWKEGDDYFIRLRPIKSRTVTQDDFEQKLVIQIMQLINGRTVQPKSSIGVRVQSYGSYETLRVNVLQDLRTELVEAFNDKRDEKWQTKDNAERIAWSKDVNEFAAVLNGIDKGIEFLEKK